MITVIATPIGNRVRTLREGRDWSQKELAARARVPRPWLSLIETGDIASPGAARLNRLADALSVDSHFLLTGEQRRDPIEATPEKTPWLKRMAQLPLSVIRPLVEAGEQLGRLVVDEQPDSAAEQEAKRQRRDADEQPD